MAVVSLIDYLSIYYFLLGNWLGHAGVLVQKIIAFFCQNAGSLKSK